MDCNLCVITRNRPGALTRCLDSYLDNAARFGHRLQLFVVDDSASGIASGNRGDLASVARRHGVPIRYLDREHKVALATTLSERSGTRPDIARFLLAGSGVGSYHPGANRNALLLGLAGKRFYCVDDDTLCATMRPRGWKKRITLTSQPNPTEVWALSEAQGADEIADHEPVDFFGEQRLLGETVETLTVGAEVERREVGSRLTDALASASSPRVRMTIPGIIGDCGYRYSSFLLMLQGKPRDFLIRSEDHYRRALTGRQIVRSVTNTTVGDTQFSQTTAVGLDDREMLPPFAPSFRGEDLLFGALLRRTGGGSLIAYLPFTIAHTPFEARQNADSDLEAAAQRVTFRDYLGYSIWSASRRLEANGAPTLEQLGAELLLRCSRDANLVEGEIRRGLVETGLRRAEAHEKLAGARETPEYLSRDLLRVAQATRTAVVRADYHSPEEFRGASGGVPAAIGMLRTIAEGLQAWPSLFAEARAAADPDRHFETVAA